MKEPVSGHGELVLGAPDEPIRRQRQTVSHLGDIDDRLAGIYGMIETAEKNIGNIYKLAQSSLVALWVIAGILIVQVIHHW
jgi:hypothetical protein